MREIIAAAAILGATSVGITQEYLPITMDDEAKCLIRSAAMIPSIQGLELATHRISDDELSDSFGFIIARTLDKRDIVDAVWTLGLAGEEAEMVINSYTDRESLAIYIHDLLEKTRIRIIRVEIFGNILGRPVVLDFKCGIGVNGGIYSAPLSFFVDWLRPLR